MKLSQKIVEERKKRGWSQEELAFRLNVSRQAVGKWETDLTLPEVDKIVQMAKLFGVSCDYLLNDDSASATADVIDNVVVARPTDDSVRQNAPVDCGERLSENQLAEISDVVAKTSIIRAIATALCVLSPVVLILLVGLSAYNGFSENLAVGVGLGVLLTMVAVAVVMFVLSEKKSLADYNPDMYSKELLHAQVSHRKGSFVTLTAVACGLCVLSAIPLLVVVLLDIESLVISMVAVLLGVVSVAVFMYVYVGTYKNMYSVMCGEAKDNSSKNSAWSKFKDLYWLIVVAAYLAWSFIGGGWAYTWIIWPIAAVCSAAIGIILELCGIKHEDKQ